MLESKATQPAQDPVFLRRVTLKNYRSIKSCSVGLGPLTFLVGQNGAGKSNFLDALRLVTESLTTSIEHALMERGGIQEVRRRSSGHPTHFGIRLDWQLTDNLKGVYAFQVAARPERGFEIQREECRIQAHGLEQHYYKVENGKVASSFPVSPPASPDRLYLVAAAGIPAFRPVYDALSRMGFYNLNPDVIRELQAPDPGEVLKRDGANLASILSAIEKDDETAHKRLVEFLSKVSSGIHGLSVKQLGKKATIEFRQAVGASPDPWRFPAENMSDGTLRALGVLTALFQPSSAERRIPFIGIEEPETAVHPGAAGVLRDALRLASNTRQVAVTSHSPDLLDDAEIDGRSILAVVNRNGETVIGPIDAVGRDTIRERLYTAGELLRIGALSLDESSIPSSHAQLDLFGGSME